MTQCGDLDKVLVFPGNLRDSLEGFRESKYTASGSSRVAGGSPTLAEGDYCKYVLGESHKRCRAMSFRLLERI